MRKDRLYLYTFLAIAIIFTIIGGITTQSFIKTSADDILSAQLESSKGEAKQISFLIGNQLENGVKKDELVDNFQRSIEVEKTSDLSSGFVSILDWSGKFICHPIRPQLGSKTDQNKSTETTIDGEITPEYFYDLVVNAENKTESSQIISLYPVPNSDWLVASHVNVNKISSRLKNLRNRFYALFSIMGLIIILSSVITVRFLGSQYEKRLETKNQELESEVINLAKLNSDLGAYQKRVIDTQPESKKEKEVTEESKKDTGKRRILTYLRNELLPIATDEIAYIYTENTITYVVDIDGKRSTTNSSLDELFSSLDSSAFYRANRQFIIAIAAIDKIIRYGNNQLKLVVNPNSEVDIIIGKNKAAEFKQWLNL